jgi:uncharacterized protein (DUF1330 family)
MSKKKIFILLIIAVLLVVAVIAYREYNRGNIDLSSVEADIKIEAAALIKEYETNDSAADHRYRNKILAISGNVKALDTSADHYTIIIGDEGSMSSVRCSLDSNYRNSASSLRPGSRIQIKGAITGFRKDDLGIGSDVELNRCVVQN